MSVSVRISLSCSGIKTIYINRSTEDVGIDRNEIRKSVDVFVDQGGLLGLSELLQA